MKQTAFASLAWNAKGRTTRRERFLAEMNAVVPWARLTALIEPHYPKGGGGRPPMPLERMLRVYLMQQWFNLSDPQAEDAFYDIEAMRRFAGSELAEDAIPDESTILHFHVAVQKSRIQVLLKDILPSLEGLDSAQPAEALLRTAVEANVRHTVGYYSKRRKVRPVWRPRK